MKCNFHPERESIGKCIDCGKEICSLCVTTAAFNINASHIATPPADKHYCPTCIEKLTGKNIEWSPNINTVTANASSSKQNLATGTTIQESAAATTMKSKEPIKVNKVSMPEKPEDSWKDYYKPKVTKKGLATAGYYYGGFVVWLLVAVGIAAALGYTTVGGVVGFIIAIIGYILTGVFLRKKRII